MICEWGRVPCGDCLEEHGGEGVNKIADGQACCDKSDGDPDKGSGGCDGVAKMLVTGEIVGVK